MNQRIKNLAQANPDILFNESSIRVPESTEIKTKLRDLKAFIDEMLEASAVNQDTPVILKNSVKHYEATFLDHFNKLLIWVSGEKDNNLTGGEKAPESFLAWYDECVGNRPNDGYLAFLDAYNTAKNFGSLRIAKGKTKQFKSENFVDEILANKKTNEKIEQEARKFAGKTTFSNYAEVFGDESISFSKAAYIWLGAGIVSIAAFTILIFTISWNEILPTEAILSTGVVKYYISNILLKTLLFGVLLFFISFAFKQFAVNRHNSVINRQRKNAMNSYQLFVESADPNDTGIKNILMQTLAKAIYEQSTTGFITEKNQPPKSGIVELTKLMQSGSTD